MAAVPGCCTGRVKLGTDLGRNSRLMHRNGSGAILTKGTHTSTGPTRLRQLARCAGTVKLPTGLYEVSAVRWGFFEVSSSGGHSAHDDMNAVRLGFFEASSSGEP